MPGYQSIINKTIASQSKNSDSEKTNRTWYENISEKLEMIFIEINNLNTKVDNLNNIILSKDNNIQDILDARSDLNESIKELIKSNLSQINIKELPDKKILLDKFNEYDQFVDKDFIPDIKTSEYKSNKEKTTKKTISNNNLSDIVSKMQSVDNKGVI